MCINTISNNVQFTWNSALFVSLPQQPLTVSSICWVCQWSTAWVTSSASSRSCAEACCVRTSSVTSPSPLHRLPPLLPHSTLKSTQTDSSSQVRAHHAFMWPVFFYPFIPLFFNTLIELYLHLLYPYAMCRVEIRFCVLDCFCLILFLDVL